MKKKILILTASYGTGHVMVAKALDEAFRKKNIEPVVFDLVEIGGKTEKLGASFYSFLMKKGHFIWKLYHEKIMPIRKGDSIRFIYKRLHKEKFFSEIEKIKPDLIISTMDQASVVASLFKENHSDVKIATVLTDYVAHPVWVWKNMDYYFVGSQDIKKYLERHGVESSNIYFTGIPLRSQFENVPDKKEARQKLGLPLDKTIVLVSSGSFGTVPVSQIVSILKNRQDILVVIISGIDKKVPEYASLLQRNGVIGKVVSYTNEMEVFMSASDLFISKAGGATVAECLACGLPALYLNNFPGHEVGNALYAEKYGAAKNIKNKNDLSATLIKLLENKEVFDQMSKNAKKLSSPHASFEVIKTLL